MAHRQNLAALRAGLVLRFHGRRGAASITALSRSAGCRCRARPSRPRKARRSLPPSPIREGFITSMIFPMASGRSKWRCSAFQTIHAQVTIGAGHAGGKVGARAAARRPAHGAHQGGEESHSPAARSGGSSPGTESAPTPRPKCRRPRRLPNEQSADGYLVKGSVNNAATSRYSTNPAFGNTRSGSRALVHGRASRRFSTTPRPMRGPIRSAELKRQRPAYDLITNNVYIRRPVEYSAPAAARAEFFCELRHGRAITTP